jgi:hypothetical protein
VRLIDADALELFIRTARQALYLDKTLNDLPTRDNMLLNFQQYVHLQPAINAAPVVRGEWIEAMQGEMHLYPDGQKMCSICGQRMPHKWEKMPPYCFACGTKMEEQSWK